MNALVFGLGQVFLFTAPCDPAACKIIRTHLDRALITRENPDEIHPELSGNMRKYYVTVSYIDLEHCIRQRFDHRTLQLNNIIFSQTTYLLCLRYILR